MLVANSWMGTPCVETLTRLAALATFSCNAGEGQSPDLARQSERVLAIGARRLDLGEITLGDDDHRVLAMLRDELRSVAPGTIYDLAEASLCILRFPAIHAATSVRVIERF